MKPGSAIVDLAADTGGNCALTRAGEVVDCQGVSIVGAVNLPSTVPLHASLMFSKNVYTLLQHMIKDAHVTVDVVDDIVGPMCLTHAGQLRTES
jgi:NAD(P) transhydrogenase subunit alpha